MYYVYILQGDNAGKFYTGFTKDLKLRFDQPNKGLVESTWNRIPLRLVYYEACLHQDDATRRGKYLKTYHACPVQSMGTSLLTDKLSNIDYWNDYGN